MTNSLSIDPNVRKLAHILLQHKGIKNAISSGQLADRIKEHDSNGNPRIRGLIRDVIECFRLPIGACHKGYYYITDREELESYLNDLDGRIAGIEERKDMVRENYYQSKQTLLPSVL